MFRTAFMICLSIGFVTQVAAQNLPQSNIFLFDLQRVTDTSYAFTKPRFLTFFNPTGYNNQPTFISSTELYITCQTPFDRQPDLFALDLEKRTKTRVTATPDGEFSPARTPSYYEFSAVRQETRGRDTVLRLWQFPLDRLSNGKPVFKYLTGIGYYHWLSGYQVAVFIVDNPNYLAIADTRTDQVTPFANDPGRCFMKMPNGNLAFVQKNPGGNWVLMEKNLFRPEASPTRIIETLPGAEDFVVLTDGTFLMGKGSKVFKFNRFTDQYWIEVADLRFYQIRNITRMALSPDNKIAVVAE